MIIGLLTNNWYNIINVTKFNGISGINPSIPKADNPLDSTVCAYSIPNLNNSTRTTVNTNIWIIFLDPHLNNSILCFEILFGSTFRL